MSWKTSRAVATINPPAKSTAGGSDAGACGVAISATTGADTSELASPVERVLGLMGGSINWSGSDGVLATASPFGVSSGVGDAVAIGEGGGVAGGGDAGASGVATSATTGADTSELASPVGRALGLTNESTNSSGSDGVLATASALGDAVATGEGGGVAGGSDAGAGVVAPVERALGLIVESTNSWGSDGVLATASPLGIAFGVGDAIAIGEGGGVAGGSDAGAGGVAPVERALGLTDESTNSSGSDGVPAAASALGVASQGTEEVEAGIFWLGALWMRSSGDSTWPGVA